MLGESRVRKAKNKFYSHAMGSTSRSSVSIHLLRGSALALACASLLAIAPASFAQSAQARSYAAGRVLVMPRAGLSEAALGRLVRDSGGLQSQRIGRTELRVVTVPPGQEQAAVERLKRNPHVKFAEVDGLVSSSGTVNDPYFGSQWHLPKIGAPGAWDAARGSGVTIAILDSGIDTGHPDFAGRLLPGYNFVDGNTNVADVKDHGTKVAGSAAAAMNNAVGVASVAGSSMILPLRVSNSDGTAYLSTISNALTFAADNGARVVNMSFNGVAGSSSVLSAADYLRSRGGLAFVSAGNSNTDPGYANTNSIIIVAATDSNDAKASFSNFGDHVHLAAPGVGIYTTTWGQSYASASGTSFSAPIAAATAALVMSANPALTNAQVENILFSTALDLGAPGRDIYFGYGRVDAAAAVNAALSSVSAADTQAPLVSFASPLSGSSVSGWVPVDVGASDNIGVTKVELLVDGALVATDTSAPYAFSWDSNQVANGTRKLTARAHDAAGNRSETSISIGVSNVTVVDTTPPSVSIMSPANGAKVNGQVSISVSASDNAGTSGIKQTLSINGKLVASSKGGTLSYKWDVRRIGSGYHQIAATATDAAGNTSSTSITVKR
jgi:subtilisin family serine protease